MNDYCKLIKIHCVASPRWQAATIQKSRAFLKASWYVNILVLPVNILTVRHAGLLGCMTHFCVS